MMQESEIMPAPVFRARSRKDFEALMSEPLIIRPLNRYWRRFLPKLIIPIGETQAMALLPPPAIITYKVQRMYRPCKTIILDKEKMEINYYMGNER